MANNRLELQTLLQVLLGSGNVYFQPPPTLQMQYPAIVYHRDSAIALFADDRPYHIRKRYKITVIDKDPDSYIPDRVALLPMCQLSTHYTVDNLNHDVFNLYF